MTTLQVELIKGAFTLASVALGSLVALYAYFRQKQYELAKQRYLEEGVDVVAAEAERAMGVVSHNFARALQLCSEFRDYGDKFDVKNLEHGFLPLDNSNFRQVAHLRVRSLLQSQVVWDAFQTVMVYTNTANSIFASEIPNSIRRLVGDTLEPNKREERSEQLIKTVNEAQESGFKHTAFLSELHKLARLIESKRLSLKAIAKFSREWETSALVARLEAAYPDGDES